MGDDEDGKREFRWEAGYEKTWNAIREDHSGRLVTTLEQLVHGTHSQLRKKRRRLGVGTEGFVRLGMMRHLFVIIDLSEAMQAQDLKPTRLACTLKVVTNFVRDYFDQNPISQLGLIVMSDRRAERLTELSGNPRVHLAALEKLHKRTCTGEPSLQNALLLAESRLKYTPHHSEVLVIVANLTTCDPGDIHQTIQSLATNRIRCSVISLAAEVFVYRALAQLTNGTMHVILDETHFKSILKEFVPPPVAAVETPATLIRMGFPHSETFDIDCFNTKRCICHLNTSTSDSTQSTRSRPQYVCPRCRAAYCELPIECSVCGLTLVAAPHLARAYHHLFPLDPFETSGPSDEDRRRRRRRQQADSQICCCSGCDTLLADHLPAYRCPKCRSLFCHICDAFLHDSVHSCPSCVQQSIHAT